MREGILHKLASLLIDIANFNSWPQILSDDLEKRLYFLIDRLLLIIRVNKKGPSNESIVTSVHTTQAKQDTVRLQFLIIAFNEEFI